MRIHMKKVFENIKGISPVSLRLLKTGVFFSYFSFIIALIYLFSGADTAYESYTNVLFSKISFECAVLILAETICAALMVDAYTRNTAPNNDDKKK